jgi:hypothetical protein
MTRRHTYRVEMYAAIPYTVEVIAANYREAEKLAEYEVPIPSEQMHLPALYCCPLSCRLVPRRRASGPRVAKQGRGYRETAA